MNADDLMKPAVNWSGETWAGRIDQCASMLFCHGYIPASVRAKITQKLERECALAAATGTAKTPQAVECEASQSGGEAGTPKAAPNA